MSVVKVSCQNPGCDGRRSRMLRERHQRTTKIPEVMTFNGFSAGQAYQCEYAYLSFYLQSFDKTFFVLNIIRLIMQLVLCTKQKCRLLFWKFIWKYPARLQCELGAMRQCWNARMIINVDLVKQVSEPFSMSPCKYVFPHSAGSGKTTFSPKNHQIWNHILDTSNIFSTVEMKSNQVE